MDKETQEQLLKPFPAYDVDFRPQGKPFKCENARSCCVALAYITARAVMDRLDAVVGPDNWSFDFTPLLIENGDVKLAKGSITIEGVTKHDIGDASNIDPSKGCISDALKRAAVHWGIGRYLYDLPFMEAEYDESRKRFTKAGPDALRANLASMGAKHASSTQPVTQSGASEKIKSWYERHNISRDSVVYYMQQKKVKTEEMANQLANNTSTQLTIWTYDRKISGNILTAYMRHEGISQVALWEAIEKDERDIVEKLDQMKKESVA